MARLTIPTPRNCLECEVLKGWYGTERETTRVRCHAGECEMPGCPGEYEKNSVRPGYCPLDITEDESTNKDGKALGG